MITSYFFGKIFTKSKNSCYESLEGGDEVMYPLAMMQ